MVYGDWAEKPKAKRHADEQVKAGRDDGYESRVHGFSVVIDSGADWNATVDSSTGTICEAARNVRDESLPGPQYLS